MHNKTVKHSYLCTNIAIWIMYEGRGASRLRSYFLTGKNINNLPILSFINYQHLFYFSENSTMMLKPPCSELDQYECDLYFFSLIRLNICNADRFPYISYNWIGHEKWTMYAISKAQSLFKRTQSNNIRVDYLSIFRPPTVVQ